MYVCMYVIARSCHERGVVWCDMESGRGSVVGLSPSVATSSSSWARLILGAGYDETGCPGHLASVVCSFLPLVFAASTRDMVVTGQGTPLTSNLRSLG
jgi:hypothetical protein